MERRELRVRETSLTSSGHVHERTVLATWLRRNLETLAMGTSVAPAFSVAKRDSSVTRLRSFLSESKALSFLPAFRPVHKEYPNVLSRMPTPQQYGVSLAQWVQC